jgi:ABC-type multidrug transport system fused ATPase/permease subunit
LDDPLSAVDAHVGKHLFEKAIQTYWKEKIVILATNQLQYLPYADRVIFLSNGEVVGDGTFQELVTASPQFAEQMQKYGVVGDKAEKKEEKVEEKKEVKPEKAAEEKSKRKN